MVRSRMLAWTVLVLLSPGVGRAAEKTALSPQSERLAQTAVALLEFTAGSPLTPAERSRAYELAARERMEADARDPRKSTQDAPIYAAMLRVASGPPGPMSTRLRAALRQKFVHAPDTAAIIGAHDPIVWMDPERKRVVTERTLRGLQQTYTWYAEMERLPPPGPDFIDRERAFLQGNMGSLPVDQQDAVALTEIYLPVAQRVVASATPAHRASFVTGMGNTKAKGEALPVFAANVARAVALGPGSRGGGGASGTATARMYNDAMVNTMFVQPWTGAIMRSLSMRPGASGLNPFNNFGVIN